MKYELSKEEITKLKNTTESKEVFSWFKHRDNLKFEIGDILVRAKEHNDGKWYPELLHNACGKVPQRYVYVYEDEYGIGYTRKLNLDGSVSIEITSMLETNHNYYRFQVDSEFAETILLGGEFDIKKINNERKQQRQLISNMNKKNSTKPKNISEVIAFFDKLSIGDTYWTSYTYTGQDIKEFKFVSKEDKKFEELDYYWRYNINLTDLKSYGISKDKLPFYSYQRLQTWNQQWSQVEQIFAMNFVNSNLYTSKPAEADENQ